MPFDADLLAQLTELITKSGANLLGAILIFIIGFQIAKLLRRFASRSVEKSNIDTTLGRFVINLIYYAVLVFVGMAALDRLGVDTNSLVAVIGAAGLAAGLAMEGALANFVAGIFIIVLRPFKVGDYVEIADVMGRVDRVQITTTNLITFENETVILPNRDITDGKIVNYSTLGYVEHEMEFYVDFDADLEKAIAIMQSAADRSEYTMEEPRSGAYVLTMTPSAVTLLLEANILPQYREKATYDLTKDVLLRFKEDGIAMPQQRWRPVGSAIES